MYVSICGRVLYKRACFIQGCVFYTRGRVLYKGCVLYKGACFIQGTRFTEMFYIGRVLQGACFTGGVFYRGYVLHGVCFTGGVFFKMVLFYRGFSLYKDVVYIIGSVINGAYFTSDVVYGTYFMGLVCGS